MRTCSRASRSGGRKRRSTRRTGSAARERWWSRRVRSSGRLPSSTTTARGCCRSTRRSGWRGATGCGPARPPRSASGTTWGSRPRSTLRRWAWRCAWSRTPGGTATRRPWWTPWRRRGSTSGRGGRRVARADGAVCGAWNWTPWERAAVRRALRGVTRCASRAISSWRARDGSRTSASSRAPARASGTATGRRPSNCSGSRRTCSPRAGSCGSPISMPSRARAASRDWRRPRPAAWTSRIRWPARAPLWPTGPAPPGARRSSADRPPARAARRSSTSMRTAPGRTPSRVPPSASTCPNSPSATAISASDRGSTGHPARTWPWRWRRSPGGRSATSRRRRCGRRSSRRHFRRSPDRTMTSGSGRRCTTTWPPAGPSSGGRGPGNAHATSARTPGASRRSATCGRTSDSWTVLRSGSSDSGDPTPCGPSSASTSPT